MLTRSLSYYTLSRQSSLSQHPFERSSTDFSVEDVNDLLDPPSASHASNGATVRESDGLTRSSTAMPRSISMSRLTHPVPNSSTPFKSPHTRSQIHHQRAVHHSHSRSMAFPRTPTHASTTMVELVDDSATSTPSPPATTTMMMTTSSSTIGDGIGPTTVSQPMDIAGANGKVTPANETSGSGVPKSSTPPSPNSPSPLISNSTSPVEVFSTESTSLPLFRAPIVGNALIHPVNDSLSSEHLPAALIEDFDIIGRAGEESTCDTWIVRSKNSGKLAVFKPRDGENWIERQQWESRERERLDRERRMNRFGRGQAGAAAAAGGASDHLIAEPSSSCPHPLSYSTALRTPLKRGVLYGETTRKEVAAYLMDHEHFAGVPKTVEATIFLARNQAPNQGMNKHETGVLNYHPYLHGEPPSGNLALPSGDATTSPELAGQGRLLLMAASKSPPLSAVQSSSEPHFPFDSEEVWLGPSATGGVNGTDATPERSMKFARHDSPTSEPFVTPPSHHGSNPHRHSQGMHHPHTHVLSNANLAPPPTLLTPNSAQSSPTAGSTFDSPNFGPTAGSSPDRDSDGGFHGLGLGLPTSASELVATYGSLQEFVENQGSAEDMGSNVFLSDEVHRIGILDVRLLNLDRHLGNLLVSRDHAGRPHLIPVDHGFSLPSVHALQDVHLEWTYWRQCMEPFSKETLRYIARLDPIADAAKLRNIGIRDEALVAMVFSSLLLKYAAASGLTLFHIARMCQRDGDGEEPSTLEVIVARVLGSQIDASPEPPMTSPNATTEDQPAVAFDYTMTTQELPVVEEEGLQSPSSLASSRYMSRQTSSCSQHGFQPSPNQSNSSQSSRFASPAPYPTPTPRTDSDEDDCDGEEVFPSRPSTELTIPSATDLPPAAPMTTLLTRSNSDGAMALAEAIIGRQYSAPNLGESENKDENAEQTDCVRPLSSSSSSSSTSSSNSAKRPWNGFTRRRSIADAAAQIIALVTPSGSSPPSNPFMSEPASITVPVATSGNASKTDSPVRDSAAVSSPDCEFSPVELPTPPPPNILRLGTELTLYEANANSSNGGVNGDIPTGPKLQHLLHITETVIREELANYCQRQGITLQTPTAASASSKESPPTPSASSNSATSSNSTTTTATILHAPTPRSPSQSLPQPSQSPRTSSINGNELGSSQSAPSTASPYTRTPSLRERLAAAAAAKRAAMAAAAAGTTATSTSAVSVAHSSSSLSSLSLSEVPTSTAAVAATSLTPLGSTLPSIQLAPPSLVIPPIVHHHTRDKDDSSSSLSNVPSHIVTSSSPPSSTSSHLRTYSNVDSHVTVEKHHPITAES